MANTYRPCQATMKTWNKDKKPPQYDITKIKGNFHHWGVVSTNEKVMDTMAIIEAPDGQIFTAWPADVVFLDKK